MWNETVLTLLLPYINELLSGIIVVVFTVIAFYAKKYIGVEIELKQKDLEAMNRSVLWQTLTNAAIAALTNTPNAKPSELLKSVVDYAKENAKDAIAEFKLNDANLVGKAKVILDQIQNSPK